MCAAEGLLACVTVAVDAQGGRAGEGLVACAADVAVVILLVGGCAGWREVVVVLPGWSDGGDEGGRLSGLRVVDGGGEGGCCWGTVVHCGCGCLYRASV
jgi:hypothetical protein